MTSGTISLDILINYVKNDDPKGNSLHGNSSAGRAYGKLAKALSAQIADERGFYLWGNSKENGL